MHLLNLDETLEKVAALEAAADLGKILSHKWHSHIAGGLADKRSPADFPREDLLKGMVVEMEHTSDPSVACEIAMDHLVEDQHYYNHEQDMAKEVREKLGHVVLREDGAIKLAEALGIRLAGMSKEAWNPVAAVKSVGSKLLGKAAPKAVGTLARGAEGAVAHGAEGAMGKVLPFNGAPSRMGTMGGHAQQSVSGLERTSLDLRPAGAASSAGPQTVRPGANPVARPVGQVQPQPQIQEALRQAKQPVGERVSTTAYNAHLAQKLQEPIGPGRKIGADEWIKAHPAEAASNRAGTPKAQQEELPRMSADTPAGPQSGASFGGRNFAPAGYTPGAVVPNGGGGGGGPATRGGSPGSVAPNSKSTGPQVKRFGMGKALAAGGLAAGAYGAYKAVPWAANKMDEANSTPMAYGGGWSPVPYGYGSNPYGQGMPSMGAG